MNGPSSDETNAFKRNLVTQHYDYNGLLKPLVVSIRVQFNLIVKSFSVPSPSVINHDKQCASS